MMSSSLDDSRTTTRRGVQRLAVLLVSCVIVLEVGSYRYDWIITERKHVATAGGKKATKSVAEGEPPIIISSTSGIANPQRAARTTIQEDIYYDQASLSLHKLEQDRVFDTSFSTHNHVLNRLADSSLEVVVTGGSASARPGNGCGRYSDMLQEKLDRDAIGVRVFNMAQGSSSSVTGAMLMDEYFDVNRTDLIVWEFGINDYNRNGEEQSRKLEFWLTRLKAHFAQAGKKPPPILLVFLWASFVAPKVSLGNLGALDLEPMSHTGELIDSYRSLGWDIAVMDVGGSLDVNTLQTDMGLLLDDVHHPGCDGANLIADMIRHIIYTNLAVSSTCSANNPLMLPPESQSILPPHNTNMMLSKRELLPELWKDLFNEQSKVGSITALEPRLNVTSLKISDGSLLGLSKWPKSLTGVAKPGRADRKYCFVLPSCDKGNHNLNVTLLEPGLKWLGFHLQEMESAKFNLSINGLPVAVKSAKEFGFGSDYLNAWTKLSDTVPKADQYHLSMCGSNGVEGKLLVGTLVAISLPSEGDQNLSMD